MSDDQKNISPIERLIMEKESEEVGGVITQLFGEQGAGKTLALTNKALLDYNADRIIFWRGQTSCQWIFLAANNIPVTLWMHESYQDFGFYLTGSKNKGIKSRDINIEEQDEVDIKVETFSSMDELVEKASSKRANVYYLPWGSSERSGVAEKDKYFYQKKHVQFFNELNNREFMDHVSILNDENSNVFSTDTHGELWRIQTFELPSEVEDFRKNRVSHMGASHSHSDVHHKYHDVKANDRIYMRRAKVHRQDQEVSQGVVNQLDRGQFVVPGFEKDTFEIPFMPHENIEWMPNHEEVLLKMRFEAEIPDLRPENVDVDDFFDDKPFSPRHLDDLIDITEAAIMTGWTERECRRKCQTGKMPAIKLDDKWVLSASELINLEDIPIEE